MKKLLTLIILPILILSVSSCQKVVDIDMSALREEILAENLFVDQLVSLPQEKIGIEAEIDKELYISGEFWKGTGVTGEEIGLFECGSVKDAKSLESQLTAHKDALFKIYEPYSPESLPRISNAVIRRNGTFVVYISAEKYKEAGTIVTKYFG